MGFFKKIFKGVKKVFKKIGRGIKKVAGKIGKFMNKIGIVGQIAMAFILPGIGAALMNGLGGAAASMVANTFGGITGAIVKGAGHVLNAAHKFVTVGKNVFNTVSKGITKFVGEFGKTALNKIPGVNIESASKNFFGTGGAWETVQKDIVKNASNIFNPFKSTVKIAEGMSIDDVVSSTGVPKAKIQDMNVTLDLDNLRTGQQINFDAGVNPYTYGTSADFAQAARSGNLQDMINETAGGQLAPPRSAPTTAEGWREAARSGNLQEAIDATSTSTSPESLLTPPDSSQTFTQSMLQSAKEEIAGRYDFSTAPIASTLKAVGDAQAVEAQFSDPVYDDGLGYSAPMYVASSAQDFDVRAPSAPRNFNAYSGGGQFGSTARVYDTILMSPVSTWSRDLSSRYA